MTNEEIIKGLQATNEHIGKHFNEGGAWMAEFIDNAIKALEQTELNPSYNGVKTELEPCEDCISRQMALHTLNEYVDYDDDGEQEINVDSVFITLEELPSVTPKPKIGHWIDMNEFFSPCECSECEAAYFKKSKYCPNCGADMRESEDRE